MVCIGGPVFELKHALFLFGGQLLDVVSDLAACNNVLCFLARGVLWRRGKAACSLYDMVDFGGKRVVRASPKRGEAWDGFVNGYDLRQRAANVSQFMDDFLIAVRNTLVYLGALSYT